MIGVRAIRLVRLVSLLGLALLSTRLHAGTITVTLTLSDLPSNITLCRDSVAIDAFQSDEQWQIPIDVDGNPATGDVGGADVLLLIVTTPQSSPCSTTVVPLTAGALSAELLVWNPGGNTYGDGGPLTVGVDVAANTLSVTADTANGPLAAIGSGSRFFGGGFAGYSQGGTATFAYDPIAGTGPDVAISDPAGDVAQCSSPCSMAAEYYPMIDIVGFKASTGLPPVALDSVQIEFDLAGLPASMTLCRDPSLFTMPGLADSQWAAAIDVDANPATGSGGYDAVIFVFTTPQAQGCATTTAPTAGSLFGEIDLLDDQGYPTYVGDATISVDAANGKIIAAVPYDSPALARLSPNSSSIETAAGLYALGPTYATDSGSTFMVGKTFSDSLQDVQNCSTPCGTAVFWYAQTDLAGGSIVRADRLFESGFE